MNGQTMSNTGDVGGDIHQYQAVCDFYFYPQDGDSQGAKPAEYEVKWSWKSPLILAVLTWISVIMGVLSLGSVYKVFEPLVSALVSGTGFADIQSMGLEGAFLFLYLSCFSQLRCRIAVSSLKSSKQEPYNSSCHQGASSKMWLNA